MPVGGSVALDAETVILILRFAILLVLYLFLWQLVLVIWRDLRTAAPGDAEPARTLGRLVVLDGGATPYEPGSSFPIHGTATLGRGPDNSIPLADGFVSTHHAVLGLRDGGWWLEDLGSRNGTWVNGERIEGAAPLRVGDVVAIGPVKLKLAK